MNREISLEKACKTIAINNKAALLKLTGYTGIPDRMLLKNGKVIFIEFKDKKGKIGTAQLAWKKQLEKLGFRSEIVYNKEEFMKIMGGLNNGTNETSRKSTGGIQNKAK